MNVASNNIGTDLERILNALDTKNLLLGTATSSLDNRTEGGTPILSGRAKALPNRSAIMLPSQAKVNGFGR